MILLLLKIDWNEYRTSNIEYGNCWTLLIRNVAAIAVFSKDLKTGAPKCPADGGLIFVFVLPDRLLLVIPFKIVLNVYFEPISIFKPKKTPIDQIFLSILL